MRKKILAVAMTTTCLTGFSAQSLAIPDDILNKQRQTLQHYGAQSKLQVSDAVAKDYSFRIGNMIKSLAVSKARFDSQIGASQPSNPYAKYNGVWEITTGSSTLQCNDPNRTRIPLVTVVSRARASFSSNGTATLTPLEVNQTPGETLVSFNEETRAYSDGTIQIQGEARRYSQSDGYYDQAYTYNGRFTSSVRFSGNQNMTFYFESYGATCRGSYTLTGNKVGN